MATVNSISVGQGLPQQVYQIATTTGGATGTPVISAAGTNATSIKSTAGGHLYAYDLFNNAAYAVFMHFYDVTTVPTPGTTAVAFPIGIPAGGRAQMSLPTGLVFKNGIAYSITKAGTNSDTTAVAANDVTGYIAIA